MTASHDIPTNRPRRNGLTLDAQQYAPRIRPYKKTHTCMCFCTLRNGREAVASIWTAYGG